MFHIATEVYQCIIMVQVNLVYHNPLGDADDHMFQITWEFYIKTFLNVCPNVLLISVYLVNVPLTK